VRLERLGQLRNPIEPATFRLVTLVSRPTTLPRVPTHKVFQKELYNGIPNVSVWRVLRKRLYLKEYKLYMIDTLYALKCKRFRNTRHVKNTTVTP
jgi:hypothetical protein